jgi:hypothetical protein
LIFAALFLFAFSKSFLKFDKNPTSKLESFF